MPEQVLYRTSLARCRKHRAGAGAVVTGARREAGIHSTRMNFDFAVRLKNSTIVAAEELATRTMDMLRTKWRTTRSRKRWQQQVRP